MESTKKKKYVIKDFLSQKLEIKIKSPLPSIQTVNQIDMGQLYQEVCSNYNQNIQLSALIKVRDLSHSEYFCNKCINYGSLLVKIAKCLYSTKFEIKCIAAQIFANFTMHTKYVLKIKEVSEDRLLSSLRWSQLEVRQYSLIALGNIASDVMLEYTSELLEDLNTIVCTDHFTVFTPRIVSQLICNMLCHKKISIPILQQIVPIVKYLITSYTDDFVLPCITTIIYLLSMMGCEYIDVLIVSGIASRLVGFLSNDRYGERHIALKAIKNISTSMEEHIEALFDDNILSYFPALLLNENDDLCEDAILVVANITKASKNKKQAIIDAGILHLVIENLNKANSKISYKCTTVIANMFENSSKQQKESMIRCDPLFGLCNLLHYDYINSIEEILECLLTILKYYGNTGGITLKIEECGGLETLQKIANKNVIDKAQNLAKVIIEDFFNHIILTSVS